MARHQPSCITVCPPGLPSYSIFQSHKVNIQFISSPNPTFCPKQSTEKCHGTEMVQQNRYCKTAEELSGNPAGQVLDDLSEHPPMRGTSYVSHSQETDSLPGGHSGAQGRNKFKSMQLIGEKLHHWRCQLQTLSIF